MRRLRPSVPGGQGSLAAPAELRERGRGPERGSRVGLPAPPAAPVTARWARARALQSWPWGVEALEAEGWPAAVQASAGALRPGERRGRAGGRARAPGRAPPGG